MNKDMMNIDDFVRDKLGGHTEKEDPAAWLRMKALLDKEMPERAAPFIFRWGKPMAFLGAALLIGALCVGGYQLTALREKSATVAANHTLTSANNNTNTPATSLPQNNPARLTAPDSPSPQDPAQTGNTTENNAISGNTAAAASPGSANHSAGSGPASVAAADHAHSTSQSTGGMQQSATAGSRSGQTTASGTGTKMKHSGSAASSVPGQNHRVVANTSHRKNAGNAIASNATGVRAGAGDPAMHTGSARNSDGKTAAGQQENLAKKATGTTRSKVFGSGSSSGNTSREMTATKAKAGKAIQPKHTAGEEGLEVAKNKETANPKESTANGNDEHKDSISAISVVTRESTSRGGYPKKITRVTDTIAITKVPVSNPQPKPVNNTIVSNAQPSKKVMKMAATEGRKANKLAAKTEAEHQKKNAYAAAAKVEAKESANKAAPAQAASQSTVKVKKEQSNFTRWWQNLNLPEAMSSARRDFNSAQFYWGVTAGANYSFPNGSGSFQGVQFGPTGELVFNKHWSLFGAIKYFNRSGSKKVVSDNFARQIADQDSVVGANWYFTARTDSTNRYFNFSTVHSFEMPITLRYTIRKFYLMTGINLAYYLPVNVEKVEREYNNMNVHVITTNSSKVILGEPTKPQLDISDFGSRFGMGYVIGAGYQITPAWQADLRIVNPFWDNAKGAGAQKLSKDFYKLPSVQLSFGYQINRIRNRATFGPNSTP